MSSTTTLLLVIGAAVAVSAVIAIIVVRAGRQRAAAALARLGTPERTTAATSIGLASQGADRITGTGTLALTADEVAFAQWRPHRLVRIARTDIIAVDTTREHAGRTMKADLLRIRWRSPDGDDGEERIAWYLRDLDPWLESLGGSRRTADE